MRALLPAWPAVVFVLAAIDTVWTRTEHSNRGLSSALYWQASSLWGVYALLALWPASRSFRLLVRRGVPDEKRVAGVVLFGWTLAPVLAHQVLERGTGIGQDMSGLLSPAVLLGALVALGALVLGVVCAGKLLLRLPAAGVGLGLPALGLLVGLLLPRSATSDAPGAGGADASGRPNLLLLVLDTARHDHTSAYGREPELTPALAAFAAESLLYEEARSVSCFTFSSHLSMLTGVYPSAHGARLLDTYYRPSRARHIAGMLREAGYRTGAFVGTDVLSATTNIGWGFEVYDDQVDPQVCDTRGWQLLHDLQALSALLIPALNQNGLPHWFQDFQRPARPVFDAALDWIGGEDERPWFAMVNVYDVHWPYVPRAEARERWVGDYDGPMTGYVFRADGYDPDYVPTDADGQHLAELYDGEMWELDKEVGRFLAGLELDTSNTAVIVTSDHGEAFGEAGVYEHDDIFEPQVRVPFLLRLPGAERSGERRSEPVSGIDIAPTLLGLAGVERLEAMPGRDLSSESPGEPRALLIEDRDHLDVDDVRLALYRDEWKLLVHGSDPEERRTWLYDLERDEFGEHDLSAEYPELAAQLLDELDELRDSWGGAASDQAGPSGELTNSDALGALGYGD